MANKGLITSGTDALKAHYNIAQYKLQAKAVTRPPKLFPFAGVNIAFTSKGLNTVSIHEEHRNIICILTHLLFQIGIGKDKEINDYLFGKGMYADLVSEGWDKRADMLPVFQPPTDQADDDYNNDGWRLHGVILVAASGPDTLRQKVDQIKREFDGSIDPPFELNGKRRPGDARGQEQ